MKCSVQVSQIVGVIDEKSLCFQRLVNNASMQFQFILHFFFHNNYFVAVPTKNAKKRTRMRSEKEKTKSCESKTKIACASGQIKRMTHSIFSSCKQALL